MATILRIQVDEETLHLLQRRADDSRKDLELTTGRLVQSAARLLPLQGRMVGLSGAHLERLEAILGGGSVLNPDDLVQKVERLAGISFLHQRLPFTPNQLELLAEKAARNGLSVEQLVDRTAPRIYEQFFDLVQRV